MAAEINSILAVDFGSVHTRVVLIDAVEGVYRLVARGKGRTTDGYPVEDITVGFDRVVRQITQASGREFLTENGRIITPEREDRSGVDMFALTVSLGRPLRAVVVGLVPDVSIASAVRAASGTYIEVAEVISLEDGRTEEERLNAIVLTYPDVILIAGGTERGAETAILGLADVTRLAVALIDKSRRPTVIYSGNSAVVETIAGLFTDLTSFLRADNVRPTLQHERFDSVRQQLGHAFDRYKEGRSEDFASIGAMSRTGVLPTGQSYSVIADYLGKIHEGGVALIDIGSSSSVLAISQNDHMTTSIRTDVGVGHSAPVMLENTGIHAIKKFLPFMIGDGELRNHALNKSLRPASVPITMRDLYLEHAMLKAGARTLITGANPDWRTSPLNLSVLISGGSSLTDTGHPGFDALLLLDCVQPSGVTVLQSDPFGLIPAMGAIATETPEVVVHLLDEHNLVPLGTVVSLAGVPRLDRPAMKVRVKLDDGTSVNETVNGGHLWTFALPANRKAEVRIQCLGGTSVNGKRSVKLTLSGGAVGLIFDARGRPLIIPSDVETRAALFPAWVHEMTGDPLGEVDPAWLKTVEEKITVVEEKADRRSRRGRRRRGGRQEDAADEPELKDQLAALFGDDDEDAKHSADDELDELRNVLS